MALLALLFFLFTGPQAWAAGFPAQSVAVIYDAGNPDASIGIVGGDFLELGSWYEDFEVVGFDTKNIIVKEQTSFDAIKWPAQGKITRQILARARERFVVKQLRAIYEAQMRYCEKYEDSAFAPSLNDLINQEFLPDGFKKSAKQNYSFAIVSTGQTPRMAAYKRQPTFYAVAKPLDPEKDPYYFSVDHLGQVRFAASLNNAAWGPVWDYADTTGGPRKTPVILSTK